MSRLAKKPIELPSEIKARIMEGEVRLEGPLGEERVLILPMIRVTSEDGALRVAVVSQSRQARTNLGTMCALLQNAVRGVATGFSKVLEIEGIGFRVSQEGNVLVFSLGFSHPVRFEVPKGVTAKIEKNAIILSGTNKALVGQVAAQIRAFRKPEPYKGKGIRYREEVIRRKVGKKAAAAKV